MREQGSIIVYEDTSTRDQFGPVQQSETEVLNSQAAVQEGEVRRSVPAGGYDVVGDVTAYPTERPTTDLSEGMRALVTDRREEQREAFVVRYNPDGAISGPRIVLRYT